MNQLVSLISEMDRDKKLKPMAVVELRKWLALSINEINQTEYGQELLRAVKAVINNRRLTSDDYHEIMDLTHKIAQAQPSISKVSIHDKNKQLSKHLKSSSQKDSHPLKQQPKQSTDSLNGIAATHTTMKPHQMMSLNNDTSLEYLCERVKKRQNLGMHLLKILDHKTMIADIHKQAESQLMFALKSYSHWVREPELVVVSLALIAILEYDGNYYEWVQKHYPSIYQQYTPQQVEGVIRSILSEFKRENESGSRRRIINVAIEHALVPQHFLAAFFDFIFDIYKINFEYDVPENLYEEFQFVFDDLRMNMTDKEDISIKATQKTYRLIIPTKQLIQYDEGLNDLIELSTQIVKIIDQYYWDKPVDIASSYLKTGYEGWKQAFAETIKSSSRENAHQLRMPLRWSSSFSYDNQRIWLDLPDHRIKSKYREEDLSIVVFNGDDLVYRTHSLRLREIIGGYRIVSHRIELAHPLGQLRYELKAGEEVIYDSQAELYRNYIVFDRQGLEISNYTEMSGVVYICYKKGEGSFNHFLSQDSYELGYREVNVGDVIEVGHELFSFSHVFQSGIFGERHLNCYVKRMDETQLIPVYRSVTLAAFETDEQSSKFEVILNGKRRKLMDLPHRIMKNGQVSRYSIDLALQVVGMYTLEINQFVSGRKKRVLKETFAIDRRLEFSKVMINTETFQVNVLSSLLHQPFHEEIKREGFNPEFLLFERDNDPFVYCLPFDFGFYKTTSSNWRTTGEDLWLKEIDALTFLTLYDSMCDTLSVYSSTGEVLSDYIVLRDGGFMKEVSLSFLTQMVYDTPFISLVFQSKGIQKYTINCFISNVMNKEKTKIQYNDQPKKLEITPYYHGKNKVFFEMYEGQNKVFTSPFFISGEPTIIKSFKSFTTYTIYFYEQLVEQEKVKNRLLWKIDTEFYLREDFVGQVFKVNEISIHQFVNKQIKEKYYYLKYNYIMFDELIDLRRGIFRGKVIVRTPQKKWELKAINPVEIELHSRAVDGTMDIYISNHGDGLLFNDQVKGIHSVLFDYHAPDIYTYNIDLKDRIN
ncbi:hypothetical protein [Atopobacter phocae]|uniref:hypothetical protein n=1 Tax=Atopobacter phocae TaxID=136492 RepID=UPI0004719011|nr:hypothetical protein [Atopobacter phocae]